VRLIIRKKYKTMKKLIKKIPKNRNSKEVMEDMRYAFDVLISQVNKLQNNKMLSITITHTIAKHEKDLRHILTNGLFNTIHKDYKNSVEHINFLYVIEFPEVVSKGEYLPTNIGIHTHMVVNTSIKKETIEYYINNSTKGDVYIEDITKRLDRDNYINYMIKQGKTNILTDDNYNYKIDLIC
jgi:hypothetical protein